mmetsp:Transcript_67574/g.180603  ORF Transcript_67574/g.180603 Transcript_67574/m.180603 type:complete len:202 (+) Transcript_67574:2111-2716(+)
MAFSTAIEHSSSKVNSEPLFREGSAAREFGDTESSNFTSDGHSILFLVLFAVPRTPRLLCKSMRDIAPTLQGIASRRLRSLRIAVFEKFGASRQFLNVRYRPCEHAVMHCANSLSVNCSSQTWQSRPKRWVLSLLIFKLSITFLKPQQNSESVSQDIRFLMRTILSSGSDAMSSMHFTISSVCSKYMLWRQQSRTRAALLS